MKRERGSVLALAMIFLLLLTIVAISTSGRAVIQERLAGALHNTQLAQAAAENALRGAEWRLFSGDTSLACYDSTNPAAISARVAAFRQSQTWTTDGATEYKGAAVTVDYAATTTDEALATARLASNPWYTVELLGQDRAPDGGSNPAKEAGSGGSTSNTFYLYRITARAMGANPNTIRVLETTFVTPNLFTCTLG
jgi:type IV pilus assembly protein PilX